jgi:hypothetical protein
LFPRLPHLITKLHTPSDFSSCLWYYRTCFNLNRIRLIWYILVYFTVIYLFLCV